MGCFFWSCTVPHYYILTKRCITRMHKRNVVLWCVGTYLRSTIRLYEPLAARAYHGCVCQRTISTLYLSDGQDRDYKHTSSPSDQA